MKTIKYYLDSLLLIMLVFFTACSQEEELKVHDIVDENIKIVDLSICCETANTRCLYNNTWSYPGNHSGLEEDECAKQLKNHRFTDLYILLSYENEILCYTPLIVNNNNAFKSNLYIKSFSSNASSNKYYLSLHLNKNLNPSKIKILLSGGYISTYNRNYDTEAFCFLNLESYDKITLKTNLPSDYCNYFVNQSLSPDDDWSNIQSTITLQRLNSEIYIITTHNETQIDMSPNTMSYFYSIPNTGDKITNEIYQPDYSEATYFYPYDRFNKYTYNIGQESVSYSYSKLKFYCYVCNISSKYGMPNMVSRLGDKQNVFNPYRNFQPFIYNDKTYYLLSYLPLIASENVSYFLNEKGEELKYINLIMDECYHHTIVDSFDYLLKYNTLPMPEGGIKSNTRYIYLLEDDYSFWENTINFSTEELATRSWEPSVKINNKGFKIIVQEIDEPLPFENIEEE